MIHNQIIWQWLNFLLICLILLCTGVKSTLIIFKKIFYGNCFLSVTLNCSMSSEKMISDNRFIMFFFWQPSTNFSKVKDNFFIEYKHFVISLLFYSLINKCLTMFKIWNLYFSNLSWNLGLVNFGNKIIKLDAKFFVSQTF